MIYHANQTHNIPFAERIKIGVHHGLHNHSKAVNISLCISLIYGVGLFISSPLQARTLGVGGALIRALSGSLLGIASVICLACFPLIIAYHHNMKNHAFEPGSCDGGKLYYKGDVPVLQLDRSDPYKAGFAHGFLCADAIFWFTRFPHVFIPEEFPQSVIDKLRANTPKNYLEEMRGIAEGCRERSKDRWWKEIKITEEDIFRLNMIADSSYLVSEKQQSRVACTAFIDFDHEGNIIFARNMDWKSISLAGKYSLITHRLKENTISTGVAGFIGIPSGMNGHGLSIALNSCIESQKNEQAVEREIEGMPIALYARACLEECKDKHEVQNFVKRTHFPGPYHLIVADSQGALAVHLLQGSSRYFIRDFKGEKPLVVLNNPYSESEPGTSSDDGREPILENFSRKKSLDKSIRIEDALSLPFVNNNYTVQRVVMIPKTLTIKVAFGNAYAGDYPLHTVCKDFL